MSTKRKADGHSKTMGKLRIRKTEDSRADSERDSGFSDAGSEHVSTIDTTDSEDSPCSVVQQESLCSAPGAQPSQLAVVGGSYPSLSSMIIMNNMLLKQPGDNPPALKPWGFSPTMEVVQPVVQQPQVVFLQPVVSHRASSSISKDTASRHRHPKKYLPILKSYPKIAPHPGDSSSGRGSASSFSSSSSSSGSERSSSLASSHRERNHRDKQRLQQQKNVSGGSSSSGSTTASLPASPISLSPLLQRQLSVPITDSSASSSPASDRPPQAISRSEFTPSPYLTPANGANNSEAQTLSLPPLPHAAATEENGGHDDGSDPENKRKRFCNTYNILSKSGLLDITLRTKELLRQNRRTQVDLDRLKEHTNLFLQALQSGDTSIWGKLQASLQEEDKEKEKERCTQNSLKAD